MAKLMIFDLDGTLSNTLESIAYFGNQALAECGYPTIAGADGFRYLVGNGADELMRGMLRTVAGQAGETEVKRLRWVYDRLYAGDPLYLVHEYEGVHDALRTLHQNQVPLAVLSNKPDDMAKAVVRSLFPDIPFTQCCGQREGVARKPSPEGALRIACELGVSPAECVYVGDTDVDMETGKSAGMYTVGVLWGFRDEPELRAHGADYVIAAPSQLLEPPVATLTR